MKYLLQHSASSLSVEPCGRGMILASTQQIVAYGKDLFGLGAIVMDKFVEIVHFCLLNIFVVKHLNL